MKSAFHINETQGQLIIDDNKKIIKFEEKKRIHKPFLLKKKNIKPKTVPNHH